MKILSIFLLMAMPACALLAQEDEQEDELATIRGQLVVADDALTDLKLTEFPVSIVEQVQFKPIPRPDNWSSLSQESRENWFEEFRNSDAGKKLIAENEAIDEKRFVEIVQIDEKGSFVAYDIPRGEYSLVGEQELSKDGATFFAQIYGDFSVGDVKEIDLSKMQIDIIRVLDPGDEFPNFELKGLERDIEFSKYRGKQVVAVFAVVGANTFQQISSELESLDKGTRDATELLLICLDQETEVVRKKCESIDADVALVGGWDRDFLNQFGVQAVPCVWLIDKEGKVFMNDFGVNRHLAANSKSISKLITEFATGELEPETVDGESDQ